MKRNNKGLSLLEVTVILVLMAIIGVVVVPNMQMIQKQRARKVASEICTDLMTQRTKAYVTSNTAYKLELVQDGTTGKYYGYTLTPGTLEAGGSSRSKNVENLKSVNIEIQTTSGVMHAVSTTGSLTFNGREVLDDTGTTLSGIKITVTADKSAAVLGFDPLTGHYEIDLK